MEQGRCCRGRLRAAAARWRDSLEPVQHFFFRLVVPTPTHAVAGKSVEKPPSFQAAAFPLTAIFFSASAVSCWERLLSISASRRACSGEGREERMTHCSG